METKAIIFQCPEDLKFRAAEELANCGISMSEYLRTCLEYFVSRKSQTIIKDEVTQAARNATSELLPS